MVPKHCTLHKVHSPHDKEKQQRERYCVRQHKVLCLSTHIQEGDPHVRPHPSLSLRASAPTQVAGAAHNWIVSTADTTHRQGEKQANHKAGSSAKHIPHAWPHTSGKDRCPGTASRCMETCGNSVQVVLQISGPFDSLLCPEKNVKHPWSPQRANSARQQASWPHNTHKTGKGLSTTS